MKRLPALLAPRQLPPPLPRPRPYLRALAGLLLGSETQWLTRHLSLPSPLPATRMIAPMLVLVREGPVPEGLVPDRVT